MSYALHYKQPETDNNQPETNKQPQTNKQAETDNKQPEAESGPVTPARLTAIIAHYEAIIAQLKADLADAREQRDGWHQAVLGAMRTVSLWQDVYEAVQAATRRAEQRKDLCR
jgi:hypothetical protein